MGNLLECGFLELRGTSEISKSLGSKPTDCGLGWKQPSNYKCPERAEWPMKCSFLQEEGVWLSSIFQDGTRPKRN